MLRIAVCSKGTTSPHNRRCSNNSNAFSRATVISWSARGSLAKVVGQNRMLMLTSSIVLPLHYPSSTKYRPLHNIDHKKFCTYVWRMEITIVVCRTYSQSVSTVSVYLFCSCLCVVIFRRRKTENHNNYFQILGGKKRGDQSFSSARIRSLPLNTNAPQKSKQKKNHHHCRIRY